jgi:hypothetical protein
MAPPAQNPVKSRKILENPGKNNKSSPPRPNDQTERPRPAGLADYEQLSPLAPSPMIGERVALPKLGPFEMIEADKT